MAFSYLSHTADIKFVASGATLEEAFSEAARAVTHVMTDENIRKVKSYKVNVHAESLEALLFDFLDEVVLLLDTKNLFVHSAELKIEHKGRSWELSGELHGDSATGYERHGDVKAPTYNDLSVTRTEDGWALQAVLDI